MVSQVGAVGKHLALIGFMGAGKTTVGREVAAATCRPFVDTDEEIEKRHGPIPKIFAEQGEPEFRRIEEHVVAEALAGSPAVLALGGGAVVSETTRERLDRHAFMVWIPVEVETAWTRVRDSGRPLARDRAEFEGLYEERCEIYDVLAQGTGDDATAVLLEALHIAFASKVPYDAAVIFDERVAELHEFQLLRPPLSTHPVPSGEAAKTPAVVQRLWEDLRIGRDGWIVAFGGGSTTDVAGFVAATYLRGVRWVAVPTTLVGMVDAAIGGKTGINTAEGKNLAGAFHFPWQVLLDPAFLATLPERERRAGMAEVVKTGLLAGREVWKLPEEEMIRACAAYKAGVVLSDPYETEGRRTVLNLGHTFAHALEAGSGFRVGHGEAVALGLMAALRLSGLPTDAVEDVLAPDPVEADPDVAWAALKRDKKGEGVFVLLEEPGRPIVTAVPDDDARGALAALIRQ
ncbi:MAG TPA: bifunctional shikimate kinase/3-dehydroquinate synthase [Gaiellaceae bacterium]|nr:bifunctional shikimate kinase/3-dehydroquinate synthase [Gaiellaceae bacterium]